jgi:hypothetical protein
LFWMTPGNSALARSTASEPDSFAAAPTGGTS